jgi:hypothetical protein
MKNILRWVGVTFAIILTLSLTGINAYAQGSTKSEYFPETGHSVKGEFLQFYREIENPIAIYGYPITEEFTDKQGLLVQYFQRARFEYHPDKPEGQKVGLTKLGSLTYTPERQLIVNNPLACRSFNETGYAVCFAFLEFFEENGGIAQFGYPISHFEFHDDLIVQYFQRARFEWRPWQGEGKRVGLTDLGRAYFDQTGLDLALLRVVKPLDLRIKTVVDLNVRVFFQKPLTPRTDTQTAYILVQDQNLQPVDYVSCEVTVRLPDGTSESGTFRSKEGVCTLSFQYEDQPKGRLVYVDVSVTYNEITSKMTRAFRIWE